MQWFDVDKQGLGKLLERKGKSFVVLELLQNAWDQNVTRVAVTIGKPRGSRLVTLTVEDDDPRGFSDLSHAFTLFAESEKKGDPSKRGRFNLGEKLVLAVCQSATIETTTGRVVFGPRGRAVSRRARREEGSRFSGSLSMTRPELEDAIKVLHQVITPPNIKTTVNGVVLRRRRPLAQIEVALPTDVADSEGYLRRTTRKTVVSLHDPAEGEVAMLFEMGIPVVATGDKYHYDVAQKLPLSLERDNVPAAFLRTLRTAVLNQMHTFMDTQSVTAGWVRDALSDKRCAPEAVRTVISTRFGEKSVAYDPSDPEANKIATAKGYTVVHGGSLSGGEWENVRRAEVLTPAGQVTPSPKPFTDDPNAPTLRLLERSKWTIAQESRVRQIVRIARALIGARITARIAGDSGWPCAMDNRV